MTHGFHPYTLIKIVFPNCTSFFNSLTLNNSISLFGYLPYVLWFY